MLEIFFFNVSPADRSQRVKDGGFRIGGSALCIYRFKTVR